MPSSFGNRLRNLRKKAGLTQPELAYLIGVHETTIRRWEWDKRTPRIEEVRKLASALHVPETDLLNDNYNNQAWVLHIVTGNSHDNEDVIDLAKPTSVIITNNEGGFIKLGGSYELWNDDNSFKEIIKALKKLRSTVIQNGIAQGGIKQ